MISYVGRLSNHLPYASVTRLRQWQYYTKDEDFENFLSRTNCHYTCITQTTYHMVITRINLWERPFHMQFSAIVYTLCILGQPLTVFLSMATKISGHQHVLIMG
jgi:hypothetical protein